MAEHFSDLERGVSQTDRQTSTAPVRNETRGPILLAKADTKAAASGPSKTQVKSVLDRIKAIHEAGEGEITLSDIVSMTGMGSPPAQLTKRGSIKMKRTASSSGSFENVGDAFMFEHPHDETRLQINIPKRLAGTYSVNGPEVTLSFTNGSRIVANALKDVFSMGWRKVGSIEVLSIIASETHLQAKVDASGAVALRKGDIEKRRTLR